MKNDDKPFILVGEGNVGKRLVEIIGENNREVLIINDNGFFIDGVKYVPIKKDGSSDKFSTGLNLLNHYAIGFKERQRPSINIKNEYQRILKKISKLSRSDRDWAVRLFHKTYEKKQ